MNEGADMIRRLRRCNSTASPASLPDDDDLLWEILLRLPPQPSSLPRASTVCKRWQRLVTDHQFLRHFRAHHRKPPLLGVFKYHENKIVFRSLMDSPDRIPPDRFDLGRYSICRRNSMLSCRHGRILVLDHTLNELIVCVPLTGEQRRVAIPPELLNGFVIGAVVCAASAQGHVHGGCHSSPFKLVLVSVLRKDNQLLVCVYSSETKVWGNTISIAMSSQLFYPGPYATLVDNALYWLFTTRREGILEFNLEEQSIVVFRGPPVPDNFYHHTQIIKAKDGVIGFAVLSYPNLQMWQRNVNGHGVSTWELWKTIELHSILQIPPRIEGQIKDMDTILAYSEDIDVIFISVGGSVYMVEFNLMESKRLHESNHVLEYHPFTSFYTPGSVVAGGCNGAKMLHNT